jgi:hypothetical protein
LDNQRAISFGLFNRFKDAVILQSAFAFNQFRLSLSADLTISSFSKVQRLQSAFEVQMLFIFE